MDRTYVYKRIHEARVKKGLTKEELSKQLHITTKTLSRYENGSSTPDAITLGQLSSVLGVGLEYFYNKKDYSRKRKAWVAFRKEMKKQEDA